MEKHEFKELLREWKEEFKSDLGKFKTDLDKTIANMKEDIEVIIENKMESVNRKINLLERKSKEKNVLIHGIEEEEK